MINLRMRIIGQRAVDIALTHAHTAGMAVKVKSIPGKISVRLCGMFNRAGLREVAREFFKNRRKGFLPRGMWGKARAVSEVKIKKTQGGFNHVRGNI